MKTFKFLTSNKPPFIPNVYEEMVLKMLHHCSVRGIVYYFYDHPFVITDINGTHHKRIVLRNRTRYGTGYQTNVLIEYDLNLEHYGNVVSSTTHSFELTEQEYNNIMDRL